MNKQFLVAAVAAGTVLLAGCNQQNADTTAESAAVAPVSTLDTDQQKISYSIGLNIGGNLAAQGMEVDIASLTRGLSDAIGGNEPLLTQEQMQEVMMNFQKEQMAKAEAERDAAAQTNKASGEAYLVENASKEGVVTTDSGLQYKVITAGEGEQPGATDTVEVHYRGTLIDGTEFDSSYSRGETVSFPVNGVISGWTEALQLMPVGSKWELYIPSDLAYGAGGTGGAIGPNATLIFEVELVGMTKAG